jgi:hypothetical protein
VSFAEKLRTVRIPRPILQTRYRLEVGFSSHPRPPGGRYAMTGVGHEERFPQTKLVPAMGSERRRSPGCAARGETRRFRSFVEPQSDRRVRPFPAVRGYPQYSGRGDCSCSERLTRMQDALWRQRLERRTSSPPRPLACCRPLQGFPLLTWSTQCSRIPARQARIAIDLVLSGAFDRPLTRAAAHDLAQSGFKCSGGVLHTYAKKRRFSGHAAHCSVV